MSLSKPVFALLIAALLPLSAFAKQDTNSSTLKCTESTLSEENESGEETVGKLTVNFTRKGAIKDILLQRKAQEGRAALNHRFTSKNAVITQLILLPEIDLENCGQVCETKVETISVVDEKNKIAFVLKVNDHTYAGFPGSSITYKLGKTSFNTLDESGSVSCEGRVLLPRNVGADALENELLD